MAKYGSFKYGKARYGRVNLFLESVTINEPIKKFSLTTLKTEVMTFIDSVSDTFVETFDLFDSFTINDVLGNFSMTRTFQETVTVVDDLIREFLGFLLKETITLVDTATLYFQYFRTFIESISIKQFFIALKDGIIVGLWRKVGRHIDTWRERERNL